MKYKLYISNTKFESKRKPKCETLTKPFKFNIQALRAFDKSVIGLISRTEGAWCAGGAALALYINKPHQINDWDVFVENLKIAHGFEASLLDLGFASPPANMRAGKYLRNFTKKDCKVQVIVKTEIEGISFINDIFDDFDISVCQVAFNDLNDFYITKKAACNIRDKKFELLLKSTLTEERIEKYKEKGFSFDESTYETAAEGSRLYDKDSKNL